MIASARSSRIAVLGAGAFGTALAIALAQQAGTVRLWARDLDHAREMGLCRENIRRLPGAAFPGALQPTADLADLDQDDVWLLAMPMRALPEFLRAHKPRLAGRMLVACAKGVDPSSGLTAPALIAQMVPPEAASPVALLTGPSFAHDIAHGLPTALTLACTDPQAGHALQERLSTPVLRLYRSVDVTGAALGGALKNVVAIAAGMVMGAGLGESARAALMTRGHAEMQRLALALGGRPETLAGLSGFGDLVLTCTSAQSRNFRHGMALGAGQPITAGATVEGVATAKAAAQLAASHKIDAPIIAMVAAVLAEKITISDATQVLMRRPLKEE